MSPRRSNAEAAATRGRIVDAAVAIAGIDGFEALTIGRLAQELDMSKAGVVGPFGSKQALQEAAFQSAVVRFNRHVLGGLQDAPPGLERLARLCRAWIDYLTGDEISVGGCLLTTAAGEYDARPGRLHDLVVTMSRLWRNTLVTEIRGAAETGGLPASTDAAQLAFELEGIALVTNQAVQLHQDREAAARAHLAIDRLLGCFSDSDGAGMTSQGPSAAAPS
ncbi:TetR/AcrR family transcriptional regulator [Nonomuraea sp. NPDC002799]